MQRGLESGGGDGAAGIPMSDAGSFDLEQARTCLDGLETASRHDVLSLGPQLADWLEAYYVGLDRVRERGFDPVAALRTARQAADIERAFVWLGDRHTFVSFRASARRRGSEHGLDQVGTLHLPIRIDSARGSAAQGAESFWITEVAYDPQRVGGCDLPQRGDEVTHWNGVPVERVIRRLGAQLRGAHGHARRRLGLRALTRRVVEAGRLPEEDWVVLTCRRDGARVDHRLDWRRAGLSWPEPVVAQPRDGDCVRLGHLGEPGEMAELLWRLRRLRSAGRPLLLDLRGNAGGSLHGMLLVFQAITGRSGAQRLRFQFRASDRLARDLSVRSRWRPGGAAVRDGIFAPHRIDDVDGSRLIDPRPDVEGAADVGVREVLRGRVGLLVDASTFSAAEILTAMLRAEGATVFGTDPCTGDGPDNSWSLAALRRLCPQDWITVGDTADPERRVRSYARRHGLRIEATWTEAGTRHWCLRAGAEPGRPARLAVHGLDVSPGAVAMYALDGALATTTGHEVDLQLSVRRPLIRVEDDWVPVERQDVDHVLVPTRRDLLEGDVELLGNALRLLAGDARVAPSGSEPSAPGAVGSAGAQGEES